MRKILTLACCTICAVLMSTTAFGQKFPDLDKSPMDAAAYPSDYRNSDKLIKIVYSRPQLKDRSLESLAPQGKVWRTGANEAPELTLYTEMKLGDTALKPGTYSFYAIPGEDSWTVIVNKSLNTWGSYFYEEANDVARITVPTSTGEEPLEAFTIVFDEADNGVNMHMGWDTTRVVVPFEKM
ncbi:MAG: asparagine synthetase B [Flavobacteriaceae bacterium]|nr:asparagine synthetase B [Flavobacteriaceae bacterium]